MNASVNRSADSRRVRPGRAATARLALLSLVTTATLVLPSHPAAAYYPDPYAYVPSCTNYGTSVVSLATNTVVKTLAINDYPGAAAINPGGTRAYVTVPNTRQIMVFDTLHDTLLTTINNAGSSPNAIAIDPSGSFAYVTNSNYHTNSPMTVVDLATNAVVASIPVSGDQGYLAFDPTGTRVYAGNWTNGVSVVDTATHTVVATITVGWRPTGVAVDPTGTRLYVANGLDDTVSVIDLATYATVATIAVGLDPEGVTLNPAGTRLYVANSSSSTISVIDTATNAVVATFTAGYGVQSIAFNPDNPAVGYFVRDASGMALYRFDTATNTTTGYVGVGSNPCNLAVSRGYGA
ncbi:YVTN family beta-propeller repeat protein [Rugosimonospora africana]|uniref:YNCE-like beta-propeller domain-containing protein n=1 Tax=Rugosimonospora africana TaxID=556532 RepID=A0A8J3QUL3_9ACTN|nr:beta-propeller fold lactonase family protein [Rugosimonospora africana]GIH16786.1 hypothetical protein Raf01_49580 [Rugosimonospora africana]